MRPVAASVAPIPRPPGQERGRRMADRERIRDLFADYGCANDERDRELLVRLLAADASFEIEIPTQDVELGPFEGAQAVEDFIMGDLSAQTDQRRHVITNLRFENETEDRADVRAYLSLHVTDGGALEVRCAGVYRTTVVLEGGTWRFRRIALRLDGAP
jgi:ketosteroid isomerase-like protein